ATPGERTWQGSSVVEWEPSAVAGRGGRGGPGGPGGGLPGPNINDEAVPPAGPAVRGDLKVVTTNLKPGYLRKNGVPYREKTTVTEYFNRTPETYGNTYIDRKSTRLNSSHEWISY